MNQAGFLALLGAVAVAVWVTYRFAARRFSGTPVADSLDRMAAEERATQAEQQAARLAEALCAVDGGVLVVDAEGTVVLRNVAAERFHGGRHADVLAEEGLAALLEPALLGERVERELQLFGPPRRVLQLRAEPLRSGGGIVGAVAFVRDISEGRRIESVRRDFVANVSHELKTPIGALAVLAETIAAGADPAVQQLAERLTREADRLARIVDDLLDLSLVEAQDAPVRGAVPVARLVAEAVDQVRHAAELAGIPLEVREVSSELVVLADERQLVSAIANLLDNAVKYSEAGQPVEIDASRDEDRVVISVRDHGIGIPSHDLERVFERFYRVDRARSRETGGTGLGLSIVRHAVQGHGGDVSVESREGEGSTFRISLPLAGESEAEKPETTP